MEQNIENNQINILAGSYNNEQETWKLIQEINNLYAISSQGRIMSMRDGHIMKTVIRSGYENAILSDKNDKQKGFLVHRLVAKAFIPNPNNYPIVNHKDENPLNNTVNNLEWCTQKYNCIYNNAHLKRGEKLKGKVSWNKEKCFICKGIEMVDSNNNLIMVFTSISKAARYIQNMYNKSFETAYYGIYKVIKGKRKTYLKYKWIAVD